MPATRIFPIPPTAARIRSHRIGERHFFLHQRDGGCGRGVASFIDDEDPEGA
jgi:hypothetical protein